MKLLSILITYLFVLPICLGADVSLSTMWSSNFKAAETGEAQSMSISSILVSDRIAGVNVGASSWVSKNLRDEYSEFNFGDLSLTATIPHSIFGLTNGSSRVLVNIATSKVSREMKNLYSSIGHTLAVPFKLIGNLGGSVSFTNMFHIYKYETDIIGGSNTRNQHALGLSLGAPIVESISGFASARVTKSFSHSNAANDSFHLGAGIRGSWKKLSLTIGYENADSLLMPNGTNTNLNLFDLETSSFYISTGISF